MFCFIWLCLVGGRILGLHAGNMGFWAVVVSGWGQAGMSPTPGCLPSRPPLPLGAFLLHSPRPNVDAQVELPKIGIAGFQKILKNPTGF